MNTPRRWRHLLLGSTLAAMLGLALMTSDSVAHAAVADTAPLATAAIDPGSDPDAPSSPVYAIAEANGRYYVGGNFQTVAGETQPYLAAIDVATGRLDQAWRPQVNGEVLSIAVAPDGSAVYVGGRFFKIDDSYPSRIAKLDPVTGEVDDSFDPDADAAVESLVTNGVHVWAGGVFTTIGGVEQAHLAKLDANGIVDTAFAPAFDGSVLDLQLGGNRLYMGGNFTSVDGVEQKRIAALDQTTGVLETWGATSNFKIYEVSLKPDGSILYAAGAGSLGAGGNSLTAWDTTTGEQLWRRINSGDFQAVVATDELVYIGTHGEYVYIDNAGPFLEDDANPNAVRRNKLAAFDPITGELDAWNPGANSIWGVWELHVGPSGLAVGGDFTTVGGVVQSHFAVFDGPSAGTPSPPVVANGSPDGLPVEIVSVLNDAGQGTLSIDGFAGIEPGDFGLAVMTVADPNVTITPPAGWTLLATEVAGSLKSDVFTNPNPQPISEEFATDAPGVKGTLTYSVARYLDPAVQIQAVAEAEPDLASEHTAPVISVPSASTIVHYWANRSATGDSLAAPANEATVSAIVGVGGGHINSTMSLAPFTSAGTSPARVAVGDLHTKSAIGWTIALVEGTTVPTCVASVEADGTVLVDWSEVRSARSYTLRRNGSWVATIADAATSSIVDDPGEGTWTYEVRAPISGGRTDIACTPVTVEPPAPVVQTCTATINADESITLLWDAILDENGYSVRRNGSYLTFVGNTLTFDDSPGEGTWEYTIRSKKDAVTTNTSCGTAITIDAPPVVAQTCTTTVNADNSVSVAWDALAGANGYSVRRNGSFLLYVGNTFAYDDSPGEGTWDYTVRSTNNGVKTTTLCTPAGIVITNGTPPPAGQTCTATPNADGTVTVNWSEITGEDRYIVRRNNAWLATTGNLTHTDDFAQTGDTYVIRSRQGDVTINTACD